MQLNAKRYLPGLPVSNQSVASLLQPPVSDLYKVTYYTIPKIYLPTFLKLSHMLGTIVTLNMKFTVTISFNVEVVHLKELA